jgi:DNA-binding XRE family transcriptional regulator
MFSREKENLLHLPTLWYDERKERGVFRVGKKEFSTARQYLGKTQRQMAQILGVSLKAIQSFEQGWRNIPVHIERQVLFLLALKNLPHKENSLCWVIRKCPIGTKQNCPAWLFQAGNLCWFINGTICRGRPQESWQKKIRICRQCEVFQAMVPI